MLHGDGPPLLLLSNVAAGVTLWFCHNTCGLPAHTLTRSIGSRVPSVIRYSPERRTGRRTTRDTSAPPMRKRFRIVRFDTLRRAPEHAQRRASAAQENGFR